MPSKRVHRHSSSGFTSMGKLVSFPEEFVRPETECNYMSGNGTIKSKAVGSDREPD